MILVEGPIFTRQDGRAVVRQDAPELIHAEKARVEFDTFFLTPAVSDGYRHLGSMERRGSEQS